MYNRLGITGLWWGLILGCALLRAEVPLTGRIVDETGAPVAGARIELRQENALLAAGSSDLAGNFSLRLPKPGEYDVRVERLGFYVYHGSGQRFGAGENHLTVTLNHQQEFSEKLDVHASPDAIDPQQASDRKEIDSTQMQSAPFPAPQDYRNALPLLNGVVQDNAGRVHVNGGDTDQTSYTLDGFNISDPVTGRLEARVNIETIQSMELQTSRFSAETGRGSAGALELNTRMGDDRWRFGGTNFIPGVSTRGGLHVNKWTPRLQFSGPLARGRAWFHNGFDAFYSVDLVEGLPKGEDRTRGLTTSNLTKTQVNLTPANILTASFLVNLVDNERYGLSILNPAEATSAYRSTYKMAAIRDQQYLSGALLDLGYAETRVELRQEPQGNELFEVTPYGNRGNFFAETYRRARRQQWLANLFLPTVHFRGDHQVKFGIDIERESFHQTVLRHGYQVLRADYSVARRVSFDGSPFQSLRGLEGAIFLQDQWTPRAGLAFNAGVRVDWNRIVRRAEAAPRLAAVWSPRVVRDTKFSIGWGVYHDSISLGAVARDQDQVSLSMFYLPDGEVQGPLITSFHANGSRLKAPSYRAFSAGVERQLPFGFYGKAEYLRRRGDRGLAFTPVYGAFTGDQAVYELQNARCDRYAAFDISLRKTFAGEFEWFAGYTRSSSRTSAAVEYSLESPIFGPQMPGPYPWDAPDRFHMWGWAPLPNAKLPSWLRFLTNSTTASYLVEYRTGFPFGVVDEQGFLAGPPGERRLPDYFNINLHLERKFRMLHYQWAWRFGFNNITNNGNPNTVNNVAGTPSFLTYGRGQARAFSVRLRLLGRR